jgi:hypothetical protein
MSKELGMTYDALWKIIEMVPLKEFTSAIIGAGIAGWFSFKAIERAHKFALEKAANEDARTTRQTLELLMVEVTSALRIFDQEYAPDLEKLPEGAPYIIQFPIGENTFALYDAAPICLANLHPDISSTLVRLYMRMKGMVAMIKANNDDTAKAHESARIELLRLGKIAFMETGDLYNQLVIGSAENLLMGSTADAMKLVAVEIRELHQQLVRHVYGGPCLIQ